MYTHQFQWSHCIKAVCSGFRLVERGAGARTIKCAVEGLSAGQTKTAAVAALRAICEACGADWCVAQARVVARGHPKAHVLAAFNEAFGEETEEAVASEEPVHQAKQPSVVKTVPLTGSLEEQPMAALKSSFNVAEHVADDAADASSKPLADRIADSKPVVRRGAYAELATLFASSGGDASSFDEYGPALKKMLLDNASLCHDNALDALGAFVKHAPSHAVSGVATSAVRSIVEKPLAVPKLQAKAIEVVVSLPPRLLLSSPCIDLHAPSALSEAFAHTCSPTLAARRLV